MRYVVTASSSSWTLIHMLALLPLLSASDFALQVCNLRHDLQSMPLQMCSRMTAALTHTLCSHRSASSCVHTAPQAQSNRLHIILFKTFDPSCAQIVTPIGSVRIFSAVIGRHNVPYMLAAVAVALAANHPTAMGERQITLAVSTPCLDALSLCCSIAGRAVCRLPDLYQEARQPCMHLWGLPAPPGQCCAATYMQCQALLVCSVVEALSGAVVVCSTSSRAWKQ